MRELEGVSERICSASKCLQILSNDNFDMIYSILYYLDEIPIGVRKDLIQHLNTGVRFLLKVMEKN